MAQKIPKFGQTRTTVGLVRVANDLLITTPLHRPPFRVRRTYAGFWQLSAGAWKFFLEDADGRLVFGSAWNAKDVIQAHRKGLTYAWLCGGGFGEVEVGCDHDKCPNEPREFR